MDVVVGRLTRFEMDNYDNYVPSSRNLESSFEAKFSLKRKSKWSKGKQSKSEEEDSSNSDLEAIKELLARRYPKGKGKYKDKIPLTYFSCEEVGHIATRCPNREGKQEKKEQVQKQERIQKLQGLQRKR